MVTIACFCVPGEREPGISLIKKKIIFSKKVFLLEFFDMQVMLNKIVLLSPKFLVFLKGNRTVYKCILEVVALRPVHILVCFLVTPSLALFSMFFCSLCYCLEESGLMEKYHMQNFSR